MPIICSHRELLTVLYLLLLNDVAIFQPPAQEAQEEDSWGVAFILLTLFLSICVMYLLHRTKFRYLPESVGVIIIGMHSATIPSISYYFVLTSTSALLSVRTLGCGTGIILGFLVSASGHEVNQVLALDPENFFLLLLPPIIFESGYSLNKVRTGADRRNRRRGGSAKVHG